MKKTRFWPNNLFVKQVSKKQVTVGCHGDQREL